MEKSPSEESGMPDFNKLTQDLRSFLFQLESDGYTKESLVLLLSKFESVFKEDAKQMPQEIKGAINAFIQHGFEYAEGKEGQDPLIQDLEKLQKAITTAQEKAREQDESP